jgi:hypothetical protein
MLYSKHKWHNCSVRQNLVWEYKFIYKSLLDSFLLFVYPWIFFLILQMPINYHVLTDHLIIFYKN